MKLKENVTELNILVINDDMVAACLDEHERFCKMMVCYKHGKPIWAHKDCVAPKPARSKRDGKKNQKKGLTDRKSKV